jgi:hypothetical protein
MNAPTYIDKNLGKKRDEDKMMELHTKKLKEIQKRELKAKKAENMEMSTKIKENKKKVEGFMKNEKNAEINRENQILLNKLVEISNGKWSSVTKPPVKKVKKAPVLPSKKSLNYERRKKEFERIERENMAIAQRLFNKQGSISKKKMDEDYGVSRKYKKQIQKAEGGVAIKGKTRKGKTADSILEQSAKQEEDKNDDNVDAVEDSTHEEAGIKDEKVVKEEHVVKEKEIDVDKEIKKEDPKVEDSKVEEPKKEEPKIEEPKIEEPKKEEPLNEVTKKDEVVTKVEEPKVASTDQNDKENNGEIVQKEAVA